MANERTLEIPITPAMVDAGIWVLRTAGIGLLDVEDWEVRELAIEVFQAMKAAELVH